MSAEAWPTEAAATAAVEAAARKVYETAIEEQRKVYPAGVTFTEWDDLHAVAKLEIRNQILVPVWAALEALPDPRETAWLEGLYCGLRQGYEDDNPYSTS